MDKVILRHLEQRSKTVDELKDDLDAVLSFKNLQGVVHEPRKVLQEVRDSVIQLFMLNYLENGVNQGVNYAQEVKGKHDSDAKVDLNVDPDNIQANVENTETKSV